MRRFAARRLDDTDERNHASTLKGFPSDRSGTAGDPRIRVQAVSGSASWPNWRQRDKQPVRKTEACGDDLEPRGHSAEGKMRAGPVRHALQGPATEVPTTALTVWV